MQIDRLGTSSDSFNESRNADFAFLPEKLPILDLQNHYLCEKAVHTNTVDSTDTASGI